MDPYAALALYLMAATLTGVVLSLLRISMRPAAVLGAIWPITVGVVVVGAVLSVVMLLGAAGWIVGVRGDQL